MTTARTAACVLAAWVLVAAGLADLGSARAPLASSKPQREFDYFALSLQWPGTICASTRHCCATNGCCRYVLRAAAPATTSGSPPPSYPLVQTPRARCSPHRSVFCCPICFVWVDARPHAILFSFSCPACSSEPLQTFTIRKCSLLSRSISFLYRYRCSVR